MYVNVYCTAAKDVNPIALSKHINNIIVDNYSSRGVELFRADVQTDRHTERERDKYDAATISRFSQCC